MSRISTILLVLALHFSFAGAQVNLATVLGTIQDATGAVLPGVEVTATHVDTGLSRTVVSDDEGRYRIANLNLGDYEVAASLPGFQTEVQTGIELTIGRRAILEFTLRVGEITERVTVTGETPLVETSSGTLGGLVDRNTVIELPLNGRDLTGLLTLQPGNTPVTTGGKSTNAGFTNRVSIGGARPLDVSVLLDGTEVKSIDQGVPAGISGNFIGGEAIQEFKVERNSYSAQFGGASGGVINVVSKSGGNDFHGSIYEFHRNDNLDASHFRDIPLFDSNGAFIGKDKPEFKRNQYGFSVSGPIIESKTFFFFNYEGLRDRRGRTEFRTVLSDDARNGLLRLDSNGDIDTSAPLVPVTYDADVIPFLELWPEPGPLAVDLLDGRAREPAGFSEPTNEDFYQVRVDHNLSDSDSLFVRVTRQTSDRANPREIDRWVQNEFVNNTFVTLEEKRIFSPRVLNSFRFGFNRRGLGQLSTEDPITDTALRFVPESAWRAPLGAEYVQGEINGTGLSTVGLGRGWVDRKVNSFEYFDDVIYEQGAHSWKFGFTWRRLQYNGDSPSRPAGAFSFGSLEDFLLLGEPSRFRGDIIPETTSIRGLRMNIAGWYIQDDWQVSPQFTVNLGFRHEFFTVPYEVNDKLANLRSPLTDTSITYLAADTDDAWFNNPSKASFMPRIGMAWDPTGAGKTALRLGGGLFYNHIQSDTFIRAVHRTAPFQLETNIRGGNIPFPDIFDAVVAQGVGQPDIQPFSFDYMRNPHMYQWNLNIQHEIMPGTAVTLGYAGSRGFNLMHQVNLNTATADNVNGRYVFADTAALPNQTFRDLDLLSQESSIDSWHNGLEMGLQRRFQAGWQLQLAYTYSRTVDESSQINQAFSNQGGGVNYYPDPDMHRSLAAFHVSRSFAASGIWQLPFGPGKAFGSGWSGVTEKILGGWQLSSIFKLSDGPPVMITIQGRRDLRDLGLRTDTPDLAPGGSLSPVLGGPDQYFDVSDFVFPPDRTIGTVGRNTLIGPGVAVVDFSLTKNTQASETVNVQFRAEFFNILNRANYALPNTRVFSRSGSARSGAGFIEDLTNSPREIQLGLRVVF